MLPEAKPEILVVGYANVDVVARVPILPQDGERVTASEIAFLPGGMAANCACAAAMQGSRVLFFGNIGQGALGRLLEQDFERCGVDTTMAAHVEHTTTAVVAVTPSGERAIISEPVSYDGTNLRCYLENEVKRDSFLYVDGYHLVRILSELKQAKVQGVTVFCDLDGAPDTYDAPSVLEALEYVDIAQCTPQVANGLFPRQSASEAAEQLAARGVTLLVTNGAQDVLIFKSQERVRVPIPSMSDTIDTTGAGDIFAGSFLHVFSRIPNVERAVQAAVVTASDSTRYRGARLPFDIEAW